MVASPQIRFRSASVSMRSPNFWNKWILTARVSGHHSCYPGSAWCTAESAQGLTSQAGIQFIPQHLMGLSKVWKWKSKWKFWISLNRSFTLSFIRVPSCVARIGVISTSACMILLHHCGHIAVRTHCTYCHQVGSFHIEHMLPLCRRQSN